MDRDTAATVPETSFFLRRIEVDIREREQNGEDKKGRAEQEQAVTPYQPMKDRGPLQLQQAQQRVGVMDRIETLKHDPAGRAQSQRE